MTSALPDLAVAPHGRLSELVKPRMRGWLHAYAAAVSILTGASLITVAAVLGDPNAGWSTGVYAATVSLLFGTSALYHRRGWSAQAHQIMKRLDHSMIFVFIAGSYTPFAALTLPKTSSIAVLVVVWTGAAFGVALQTSWPDAPRALSVPLYGALGWVAVFLVPELLHHYGIATFTLIAVGGVVYTLGALAYAFKRPNPYPGTFGYHEVFHACTLIAATCHYVAIWLAIFA
ncbi:MAG: channel protein hemolysin family [Frankiales bacterium]|jgi:hemolysin III|nr:channel protein hemolysin family [Frankiales bacterium]